MAREANLTEEQYAEMMRRRTDAVVPVMGKKAEKGSKKRGMKRGMNGWEQAYALELEARKQAGELLWWAFERIRFRLADDAFYKPDFCVLQSDGELVIYEIKGHWEEAARVRIKVAADRHPFRFIALRKRKADAGWDSETFSACLDRLSRWHREDGQSFSTSRAGVSVSGEVAARSAGRGFVKQKERDARP